MFSTGVNADVKSDAQVHVLCEKFFFHIISSVVQKVQNFFHFCQTIFLQKMFTCLHNETCESLGKSEV